MRLTPLAASFMLAALAAAGVLAEERESPPERISREQAMDVAARSADQAPLGAVMRNQTFGTTSILQWEPLGPKPIEYDYWSTGPASGRVSAVLVDPRDADVVYIAAAQGGVWKSTDAGSSWAPLTDHLSSLASGALCFDPRNPDVIFYGTGEQHQSGDSFYGDGLFKSTNAGSSWSKIASRADVGSYIARVATNPQRPETLYVASSRGFVRSLNGGASWTVTQSDDWVFDLEQHPTTANTLYITVTGFGIYRSTNAGASWTQLAGGLPTSGFDRVEIALAPSNPNVIYAGFATPGGSLFGMYVTTNGGTSWTQRTGTPNYLGTQGWYDHCIIADPNDADICYAGGVFPYQKGFAGVIRSSDTGNNWTDITFDNDGNSVHPDQHALAFGPDGTLWLANDGGVWKTSDGGANWINCNNGLEITMFYTVNPHPTDRDRLLGGTQDNGTVMYEGNPVWPQVIAGDGGYNVFLWNDPDTYFTTYVRLNPVYEWHLGTFVAERQGPWNSDRISFTQGPLVVDPNFANGMFAGTHRVWRTNNKGQGWSLLSGDLSPSGGNLRAVTPAPGDPDLIYAASSRGEVSYTTNASTWTRRDDELPRRPINDLWVHPGNHDFAYLCADTTSGGRVWRTSNAGDTWTDVSGDLPLNLRALSLAADFAFTPPRLYVGTDYGVYSSQNDGVNWIKEELGGLPSLAIYDLAFTRLGGELIAATHGRGMWRGSVTVLAVGEQDPAVSGIALTVPNPARVPVGLDFRLLGDADVAVEVFDVTGRRVRVIERGPRIAGTHRVTWDGRDEHGAVAGNGIYFYRVASGATAYIAKFALLR
jgi:photosystem II stability/assembly factor-like uncharacterized protein